MDIPAVMLFFLPQKIDSSPTKSAPKHKIVVEFCYVNRWNLSEIFFLPWWHLLMFQLFGVDVERWLFLFILIPSMYLWYYIAIHEWLIFYGKLVGKSTVRPMDVMGYVFHHAFWTHANWRFRSACTTLCALQVGWWMVGWMSCVFVTGDPFPKDPGSPYVRGWWFGVDNHRNETLLVFRFHATILRFGEPGSLGDVFSSLPLRMQDYPEISWGWDWNS